MSGRQWAITIILFCIHPIFAFLYLVLCEPERLDD